MASLRRLQEPLLVAHYILFQLLDSGRCFIDLKLEEVELGCHRLIILLLVCESSGAYCAEAMQACALL